MDADEVQQNLDTHLKHRNHKEQQEIWNILVNVFINNDIQMNVCLCVFVGCENIQFVLND